MNDKTKASPEWESQAVADRLRKATAPGQPSSVQVFLTDDVAADELPAKAQEIIKEASASLNLPADALKLGKVHRLAKSFSLSTDVPTVFETIARRSDVKSLLDSAQPDILPRPRDVKDVK
jgi:hypothetical protein